MTVPTTAPGDESSELVVTNAKSAGRYEVRLDGVLAGFTNYVERGDHIVFTHAEVSPEYGGRGVGSAMARFALDDVIAQGKLITPLCPFVVEYIRRNPAYAAHVDPKHRSQFPAGFTEG